MAEINVAPAAAEERAAIDGMMQLYVHDFSEHWAGTARGELDARGRFQDYPLDPYWTQPDHTPLLIRVGGNLAGFALLNASSHSGDRVDRNMAEFFVVRKHRRGGVGTTVAHTIFTRYPGQWEAAVARTNIGALAFWRSAVARCPGVSDIAERDIQSADWNGPVLRFRVGG